MSRYVGPVFKRSRRFGFSILETGKEFVKGKQRQYAPGQHGQRRGKLSDFGIHQLEKQKVRFMYGINERQFRNTFAIANKAKGVTGTAFLQLLESRLDNIVYRMGFAQTRRQARQLVNHGHFLLNGKKADIPSQRINVGDTIELRAKSQNVPTILASIETRVVAPWIEKDKFKGKLIRVPERKELNQEINEALIVEFYNK
ncbi:30S ribosomal protein S4 [[Mycoplasma] mobile]|uniref:Small ribosomal subunit protein uS4 n=1 Tax=Mycoplasma mobile (strain ATCC 43663 / 163K / NCTC 11711) TaxID=267748 RepID=RS4_MYCM1|nr:30S ribosomal protein S4 [[Mycoplasma] mobile]Q6KIM1.1 RecName: Full=Small ribosomal subunit protein uS4; AltName: Full=30S ribosomal protein S4 [Mycoplasma mobile 163K]AAT27555.1 30s ribosomal protein s4 [Mycoplasma mobile 163K]